MAWCWEPACEHIPGGRSQGGQRRVLFPQAGADMDPSRPRRGHWVRTVREGLEKGVEVSAEGTPSSPSPGSPLRTLGCSWLSPGGGRGLEASEVNLHREGPSANLKRRDSGSLLWNKLFGGRHQSRGLCSRRSWQNRSSEEPVVEPAGSQGAGLLPPRRPAPPSRRDQGPSAPGLLPRT